MRLSALVSVMHEAARETWSVFWRAALILSAIGLLLAVGGAVWLFYPWRTQNVPLRVGMTVEEQGRARPGRYVSTGLLRNLRPIREATPAELAAFTGELQIRTASGRAVALPIQSGYRVSVRDEHAADAEIEVAFPTARRLDSSVRRLPAALVAHLVVPATSSGGEFDCHLPQDALGLPDYTGELWGREYAGMAHYRWRVEFVRERAIRIREWAEGD